MPSHLVRSILTVVLVLLISAGAGYIASKSKFQYDIESFFSPSDPDLAYYHNFRKTFENDNDFVLIGLANETGIFEQDFLVRVDTLTEQLKRLDRVEYVQSPTNLYHRVLSPMGVTRVPMIHLNSPEKYNRDSTRIYETDQLINAFFAPDGKSVSIFIKKEEFTPKAVNDSLLMAIQGMVTVLDFDESHLAGRIRTQHYYVDRMNKEMTLFSMLAIALLVIYLFISFRTFWGVFIPIVVVVMAVTWTFAFMNLTGKPLDLLTTMLPTLLFVIGISGTVHLVTKYAEEVRFGKTKLEAVSSMVKEVGWATFLTSLTTAIGFFALLTMENIPVREFGIYTGAGVLFSFVVAILLLPALMLILRPNWVARLRSSKTQFWRHFLTRIFLWALRNYRPILFGCIGVLLVSSIGLSRIQVNNFFLDDLKPNTSLKQDLNFFEENFSGIRPFEMGIDLVDTTKTLLDLDVIRQIDTVEAYLLNEYGVGFLVSPGVVVKAAHQTMNGGQRDKYRLPASEKEMKRVRKNLKRYKELKKYTNLITEDLQHGRITGKMDDIGSKAAFERNAILQEFIAANTDPNLVQFQLTGAATLMDNNSSNIARNLVTGLSLALLIIGTLMGFLYRSFKMVIISLIPNVLPLMIIAGVLGFMNVNLNVPTSLIFTIAFGIAVDDTIHFLSKLKLELKRGRSFARATRNTFISTGKAIIITSLILSSGFSVFLLSDFQGTFTIGLLICITLLLAVFADLFLLPVLLLWMFRKK